MSSAIYKYDQICMYVRLAGVPSCIRLRAGLMPASGPPAREGADIETLDGQVVGTVRAPAGTTDLMLHHVTPIYYYLLRSINRTCP